MSGPVPPLALYVHMPWCVRKCPYCDFNSHPLSRRGLPEQAYVEALIDDLTFAAAGCRGREIVSVFFGGGTPSLFSPASIAAVLACARSLFKLAPLTEVTLEANPGAVERGSFEGYRNAGINRVSLGAQSFDNSTLALLGRVHGSGEIRQAARELQAAGLDNFNIDLMYALPHQSVPQALHDVECALALGPTHISHYQLTLEPGTDFAKRPPDLPGDELAYEMQLACQDRLSSAGYRHYEVSAYARDARQCAHNLNYWEFGDYLGIGAGAHGKLTEPGTNKVTRSARVRQPLRYLAAISPDARVATSRTVSDRDLAFEFFLNVLRLEGGFEPALFEARTGLGWGQVSDRVELARQRMLLAGGDKGRWKPTALGWRFLDDLQMIFLPDTSGEKSTEAGSAGSKTAQLFTVGPGPEISPRYESYPK